MNILGASELSGAGERPLSQFLAVWPGADSEHLVCLESISLLCSLLITQLWSHGWQEGSATLFPVGLGSSHAEVRHG